MEEARLLSTTLVVLNLTLAELDVFGVPPQVLASVVDRLGKENRDPVETVLAQLRTDPDIGRLVIGIKRRTPVGKAILGSVSQQLLLRAPVPVVAIKLGD